MLTPAVLALAARGVRLTEVISEERKGALCNTGLRVPGSPIAPFCCFGSQRQAVGPRGRRSWSPSRFLSTAAVPRASDLEMLPGPSSKVALRIRTPGTTTITSTINLSQQHATDQGPSLVMVVAQFATTTCVCVCVCSAGINLTRRPLGKDYTMFTIYAISSGAGLWELGKTLWQLNPHFGVQVLPEVKKGSIWGWCMAPAYQR